MTRLVSLVVAGLVFAPACGTQSPAHTSSAEPHPSPPSAPSRDRVDLDRLSVLTRGHVLSDREWTEWKMLDEQAVIERLVSSEFVSRTVAPRLLLKQYLLIPAYSSTPRYTLRAETGAKGAYFYLTSKCAYGDTIETSAWWSPDKAVRICKDDVAPAVWETRIAGRTLPCTARMASPKLDSRSTCRCGPGLIRCQPRELDFPIDAVRTEAIDTIAAHVEEERPLKDLFATKSTIRNEIVESIYRRSQAESLRLADPVPLFADLFGKDASWKATMAARVELDPGQHAGLLTAPQLLYQTQDLRQRMRIFFEVAWCAPVSAPGALPEHLLSLKGPNLAGVSDDLSSRPICTNCHARLDSAMAFFDGYPNQFDGSWHYQRATGPAAKGPLFGANIRDERGQGDLTPSGFAELVVGQPEFRRCMAENVVEYVFGPRAPSTLVDRLARDPKPTFRGLLRVALRERLQCKDCDAPATTMTGEGSTLSALVEEHCTTCHFEGARIPNLEGSLDASMQTRVLDQVMSGRMPPTGPLTVPERTAFLDALQLGPAQRAFHLEHSDPASALPIFVARQRVHSAVGDSREPEPVNALENASQGRDNTFTPSYSTLSALEAIRACRGRAADQATCIKTALEAVFIQDP